MAQTSGFGLRLEILRTEKGWTQKELAEHAGLHWMTVSKIERATQEPAWDIVLRLTRALGVDCSAFYPTDDAPPQQPRRLGRPRKPNREPSKREPRTQPRPTRKSK